jgi:hypothetical protein
MELIIKPIKMKKYNYYYDGTPITKAAFLAAVPQNWEADVNEFGEYTFGLYRANEVE